MTGSGLEIRTVTESDVLAFAAWRYDPPYDAYNIEGDPKDEVAYFLDPATHCHVVDLDGDLAAFFTVGRDAQVPGGTYDETAMDIGLGVKPELTGSGRGLTFVELVTSHVASTARGAPLRVTIATANSRALKVWHQAGFEEVDRFDAPEPLMGSREFAMLTLPSNETNR